MSMGRRRVGTFTLGISLIVAGIIAVVNLFHPLPLISMLRFVPVILLGLGVEVLIYAIKIKNEKLIYDGLAIFLCIALAGASAAAAVTFPLIDGYANTESQRSARQQDTERKVREAMEKAGVQVRSIEVSAHFTDDSFRALMNDREGESIETRVRIKLLPAETADAFAADAAKLVQVLGDADMANAQLVFTAETNGAENYFRLTGTTWQLALLDAQKLTTITTLG